MAKRSGQPERLGGAERLASLGGASLLTWLGVRRRGALGAGMVLIGGALAARAATGRTTAANMRRLVQAAERGWFRTVRVEQTITINRPRAELYRWWRNFENLPRVMRHLEQVTVLSDRRSRWVAKAPAGRTVEWEAEIEEEKENERIAWRAVEGSDIRNSGSVVFRDAPGKRGTELEITLEYEPPMGELGRLLAKMFGEEPEQQMREDLRRAKQLLEAGEIPTTQGQPSGRE
jgi:uncharacterized membrane protein